MRFTAEHEFSVLPTAQYQTDFGFDAGVAIRHKNLLGGGEHALVQATGGGPNPPIAVHERDAYTIYEVATQRPGTTLRTYVHVARDPRSGKLRVIGVWRV